MIDLTGKVALVTAATSGIGRAIALALASQVRALCIVGRNAERLASVAAAANRGGVRQLLPFQGDLADDACITALAEAVIHEFGDLDILVHSAGEYLRGTIETAPVADFDIQYRVNVRAPYLLTQTLLPALKQRRGQIVFMNSSQGITANPETIQYAATIHAMKAVAEAVRGTVNTA